MVMKVRSRSWNRSSHDRLDVDICNSSPFMIRYRDRLPQLALGPWKAVPRAQSMVRHEVLRRARLPALYPPGESHLRHLSVLSG